MKVYIWQSKFLYRIRPRKGKNGEKDELGQYRGKYYKVKNWVEERRFSWKSFWRVRIRGKYFECRPGKKYERKNT